MNNNQYQNRPFASFDSFRRIRTNKTEKKPTNNNTVLQKLKAVNNLIGDGEDHINTHHQGTTDLGKALSMYGDYEFTHSRYGRFRTVYGLMAWLGHVDQPDQYRTMAAQAVHVNRQPRSQDQYIHNYHLTIVDATWQKICAYPELKKALIESTLPFDYYYHNVLKEGSVRIRNISSPWLIAGFEELRLAAKEGREPNLEFIDKGDYAGEKQTIKQNNNHEAPYVGERKPKPKKRRKNHSVTPIQNAAPVVANLGVEDNSQVEVKPLEAVQTHESVDECPKIGEAL